MRCEVKAPSAPTVTKGPWLLALWPPTKRKLRLSSQEISSWSCCSPWMKKMDWARQTRHELKAFTEQLALILLLQVARQRSRFPPPPPPIAQGHTKESRIASTWWLLKPQTVGSMWSEDLLGNHTTLAFFFCLATRLPDDYLLRQARTPAPQL